MGISHSRLCVTLGPELGSACLCQRKRCLRFSQLALQVLELLSCSRCLGSMC